MSREPCETCGEKYPARRFYVNETKTWICDRCGASPVTIYDVYWDGKPEVNLADGPDGKPRVFLSKGEKARYMRERGIFEAGDKVHGAPMTAIVSRDRSAERAKNAEVFALARKKAESMGRDVRRQEVLRIIKQARQFMHQ